MSADTLAAPFPLDELEGVRTPALVLVPSRVEANVAAVASRLGSPARWRAHLKTAKTRLAAELLLAAGVDAFKCATVAEAELACRAGARDVLLAHFPFGATLADLRALAENYAGTRLSTLAEDADDAGRLAGSGLGAFVDVDVGMHRTGLPVGERDRALATIRSLNGAGVPFRGLHAYEGHLGSLPAAGVPAAAAAIHAEIAGLAAALAAAGEQIAEIVTSGTPGFVHAADSELLGRGPWRHTVSPGTVVYGDRRSIAQTAGEVAISPAAFVLSRIVSRPAPGVVTCDAGHKALAVDTGLPHCGVAGQPDLTPRSPSEEHLPLAVGAGHVPERGSLLLLVPVHVCPTVNLHDEAILVEAGQVIGVERIEARGHPGLRLQRPAT